MKPVIIGKGLIATTFSRIPNLSKGLIIYASGVSNSRCKDENEFNRERQLLTDSLQEHENAKSFIYFSTCSIYDPEMRESPYVKHKKQMEKLVLQHSNGYAIRMPQLVGSNAPPNTLVPYLVSKIRQGEPFEVWSEAYRNLIDVEDAALIVGNLFADTPPENHIINVANPNHISIIELVGIIETILQLKAKPVIVSKGSKYWIDTNQSQAAAQQSGITFEQNYILRILIKYYS